MKQAYLVIGCPGTGKSWVCEQLKDLYEYVRHDDYKETKAYIAEILRRAPGTTKPLLIETPFSVSQIMEPLQSYFTNGITPVFIQEHPDVIRKRYAERGNGELPTGHLSRQLTYKKRADDWAAFQGTSAAVLAYLKNAAPAQERFPWE